MPGLYRRMEGKHGRIEIPELSVPVGEFVRWDLTRRGNADDNPRDPEADYYDLFAVFRYVNKALLEDPEYEKTVIVNSNRKKRFELQSHAKDPGRRMVVSGRNLTMERVLIVPKE